MQEPKSCVLPLDDAPEKCPSTNGIFRPLAAFSLFCNPQNRRTMPAVAKTLEPCQEPKSTICGWTLTKLTSQPEITPIYYYLKEHYRLHELYRYLRKGQKPWGRFPTSKPPWPHALKAPFAPKRYQDILMR